MDRTAEFHRVVDTLRSSGVGPQSAGRGGGGRFQQPFNPGGLVHRTSSHTGAAGAGGLPGTAAHRRGGGVGATDSGAGPPRRTRTQEAATFSAAAGNIGRNIHTVARKLAELARLVRQQRVVFDPAERINELAVSIKGDMGALNSQLENLELFLARFAQRCYYYYRIPLALECLL